LPAPGHAQEAPDADRIERDERDAGIEQLLGQQGGRVGLAAVADAEDRVALAAEGQWSRCLSWR
jgi:hypothetical protein